MASMLNVAAIFMWLALVELKVKEVSQLTTSSLMLGAYSEIAYSLVVFPLIVHHLKSSINTLKKLKAREELLNYNF
jgi:threonine/homoserine/homoserine lactone efflux protein